MAVSGCGGGLKLTAVDSGRSITAASGQSVVISLDANPTTGYQWDLDGAPDPAVLKLVNSRYRRDPLGAVGGGGIDVWTFEAMGAGTTRVKLVYHRPFGQKQVAREFTLSVTVN